MTSSYFERYDFLRFEVLVLCLPMRCSVGGFHCASFDFSAEVINDAARPIEEFIEGLEAGDFIVVALKPSKISDNEITPRLDRLGDFARAGVRATVRRLILMGAGSATSSRPRPSIIF